MAATVYTLGALTSLLCSTLLLRSYARRRSRLLLWSGLCFAGLALSNVLIFLDLVIFIQVDLFLYRLATIAVSMVLLIYGLIWESQ